MTDSPLASSFVQARLYRVNPGRPLRVITIHDMEAPEGPLTAENCARYFTTAAAGGSAHYCVDTDSIVQCVKEADQAAHAPGVNTDGIGIELNGYARQSRQEWLDDTSLATLELAGKLVADISARTGIPTRWLSDDELADGQTKGLCTHAQVSRVFKRSTHTDPGLNFPYDVFNGFIAIAQGNHPQPDPTPEDNMAGPLYTVKNAEGTAISFRISPEGHLENTWRADGKRVPWQPVVAGTFENLGQPLAAGTAIWVPVVGSASAFGDPLLTVVQSTVGGAWSIHGTDELADALAGLGK